MARVVYEIVFVGPGGFETVHSFGSLLYLHATLNRHFDTERDLLRDAGKTC